MTHEMLLRFPAERPRPIQSVLGGPFWGAAKHKRLIRPVCACGHNFFPPQFACPRCLSEEWRWAESNGCGCIYTFTIVHRNPCPGFDVPFILAVIDLDEGWSMLANVVNSNLADVSRGLQVGVAWMVAEDGFTLPVFEVANCRRATQQ
jgi:uncharacterized protein